MRAGYSARSRPRLSRPVVDRNVRKSNSIARWSPSPVVAEAESIIAKTRRNIELGWDKVTAGLASIKGRGI